MKYEGYSPGDHVMLVKSYTCRGKPSSNYPDGDYPKTIGMHGVVQSESIQENGSRPRGAVGVQWDDIDRGKWTDVSCITLAGPTEEELAEVYQILGSEPQPAQPHCATCTCEVT